MRIFIFSAVSIPSVMKVFQKNLSYNGAGWIDSLIKFLPIKDSNDEVWICSLNWYDKTYANKTDESCDRIHYVIIPGVSPKSDIIDNEMKNRFESIIYDANPDIVHVFGTESSYSNYLLKLVGPEKFLVSTTGFLSYYSFHFFGGLEVELKSIITLRDLIRGSIFQNYRLFKKKSVVEMDTIRRCKNVSGRTTWDRACIELINRDVNYYFCNENLRDAFYTTKWNDEECERYSIFSSSSASPSKGAHQILKALPMVIKEFPEVKLYITGDDPRKKPNEFGWIKRTGYQKYLCKLIDKYQLNDHVIFTGSLNESEMAARCAKSNIYILPSNFENSSNSLCEAMIMGVPSIATNVGGISDLLSSGIDGFLYPFDEPYMLAYRIIQLFSNKELRCSMSENARKRALQRHDRVENGRVMMEIYKTIVDNV